MSWTATDELGAHLAGMHQIVAACAQKGVPGLLDVLALDNEQYVGRIVPNEQWWIVCATRANSEQLESRTEFVIGDFSRGGLWLPRRLDIIPPRQCYSVQPDVRHPLVDSNTCFTGEVRLFGWKFFHDEWEGAMSAK